MRSQCPLPGILLRRILRLVGYPLLQVLGAVLGDILDLRRENVGLLLRLCSGPLRNSRTGEDDVGENEPEASEGSGGSPRAYMWVSSACAERHQPSCLEQANRLVVATDYRPSE